MSTLPDDGRILTVAQSEELLRQQEEINRWRDEIYRQQILFGQSIIQVPTESQLQGGLRVYNPQTVFYSSDAAPEIVQPVDLSFPSQPSWLEMYNVIFDDPPKKKRRKRFFR